jgi:general secretion pathway protein L
MSSARAPWSQERLAGLLASAGARLWSSYKKEWRSLIAPAARGWLLERGERKLMLRAGQSEPRLDFVNGETEAQSPPISARELREISLAEALARRGVPRDAARLFLEIPREAFFVRRFDIPAAAEANLPKLLLGEIERRTPFRLGDIVYAHTIRHKPEAREKLAVELWILRRDIVMRAIENSGILWDDIDFVTPVGGEDRARPAIALARGAEESHWFRNVSVGLSTLAVALTAIGFALLVWRQSQAAEELDAKTADVSARAAAVRKIADQAVAESRLLQILREERAKTPTFTQLWEEASRILPDGAYLTELRLSETKSGERHLDLVGFADSAVGLPLLFDASPLLTDAALTAPITPNAEEKREAFSLRVKVRTSLAEPAK